MANRFEGRMGKGATRRIKALKRTEAEVRNEAYQARVNPKKEKTELVDAAPLAVVGSIEPGKLSVIEAKPKLKAKERRKASTKKKADA